MNKLIIAGNGFDLAHGLPTSYSDFMDAFWRDLGWSYKDEFYHKIIYIDRGFFHEKLLYHKINNYNDFKESFDIYSEEMTTIYGNDGGKGYEFKNQFFKELNETQAIENWVDVENEYYKSLKNIVKDNHIRGIKITTEKSRKEAILKLHKEFEQVKQLLELYLQKNIAEVYDFENNNNDSPKFAKLLKPIFYNFDTYGNRIVDEFVLQEDQKSILELRNGNKSELNQTKILNFNYTSTFERYLSLLYDHYPTVGINYIHGILNENIIFGFGDEMDEDYKLIEDMDDNEYLKYFKSFQYLQNSIYKELLKFVEVEKFQVIIMGHSCGLSDRTLLNTIFEHENCRSIKVFYHQKEEGKDNYTETIQNISRHFNDKKLMRTKIVEKTLCEPMPQIQLPRKV